MSRLRVINRVLLLLSVVLPTLFTGGCSDDIEMPEGPQPDCFNLNVSVPMAPGTRAATDNLNEFKVRSLHLYFFASDGFDEATSTYLFDCEVPGEFDVSSQVRVPLPDDALKTGGLFGPLETSNECRVYAVANVDDALLTANTVAGLKATVVGGDFSNTVVQNAFAMDGEAILSLDRPNRTVTGDIVLSRAAAKLTLAVDLPESVTATETVHNQDGSTSEVEITYTPIADGMHVWISNGVKESALNTAPTPVEGERLFSNEILIADKVGSDLVLDDSQPEYKYVQEIPFYSYPCKWEPYAVSGNSRLTLVIPWSYKDASGKQQNIATYYSLSVNPGGNEISRNRHYDMRVSVNRLGGSSLQKPVDMLFDWMHIMDWNRQTLVTDIKELRYLLLNNNDYDPTIRFTESETGAYAFDMTNTEYIEIPFSSSHPVEIELAQLKWRDYYNNIDRTLDLGTAANNNQYEYSETIAGYNEGTQYAGIEIDQVNQLLKVKRSMLHIAWENNRPSIKTGEKAISAYTLFIKLRHADDSSVTAKVRVIQVPDIYITSQLTTSNSYRFVNNNNTDYIDVVREIIGYEGPWWNQVPIYENYNYYYGYVAKTNPPSDNTKKLYFLGSVNDEADGVNNKHCYIISISRFNSGDYIIGDPRKRIVDNLPIVNEDAANSPDWTCEDEESKHLTYYYPADDNSEKSKFIAPKFRIASQWGITHKVTREGALRRCASYQENGRHAGRWRLPTIAEIEYIAKLSNKHYIPFLFGSSGSTANYWCASGGVDVNNDVDSPSVSISANNVEPRYVRCVYDEWYWGNDTLVEDSKNLFKWGDALRTVSGNN